MQVKRAATFLRTNAKRALLISLLILVPCFWHKRIEAGDLPSHTYNAWLAHLVKTGQAPSLYIEPRWNNIVVDVALEKIGALAGFVVAERLVVAVSVLIFFWGAFALISAANQRPPWMLVPAIAMVTYGWTFYSGFLNFYLAIGLAFMAVSLLWRGRGVDLLIAGALAGIALLAHPLAFTCLVGLAVYFRLADATRGWRRWSPPALALLAILGCHFYVIHLYTLHWHSKDFYAMNGADQMVLFGARYAKLARIVFAFVAFCLLYGARYEWRANIAWTGRAPLEVWAILISAAAMLPEQIAFSRDDPMPFAFLISRLTSVSAVLALCVLGSVKPRTWHLVGLTLCASLFFFWTCEDTGLLNDMEGQVEKMVSGLPSGRRIIETIHLPPEHSRLRYINHMVDRACIGKCYAYANYEPSTGKFRIRVRPGSPIVTDSAIDSSDMDSGVYVVRPQDLPMNEIYQCDPKNLAKLCIRELSAGEQNGRIGYRPQ
jgi:hypothetical protein